MAKPYFSPSQLDSANPENEGCERKWYLDSVCGQKQGQSGSAALGDALHTIRDKYLSTGEEPSGSECVSWTTESGYKVTKYPGQIFMNGKHLYPPFKLRSEAKFRFELTHIKSSGRMDGLGTNPETNRLFLEDTKTTSSPAYALDAIDLLTDTQRNMYCGALIQQFNVPEIEVQWSYFLTNPTPKKPDGATERQLEKWDAWKAQGRRLAWRVYDVAQRDQVLEQVAKIEAFAMHLEKYRAARVPPSLVPPNTNACNKYGGCPHKGTTRCVLKPEDVYGRTLNLMPSIQDIAQAAKATQAAMAAQNPAAVTPSPVQAPPPPVQQYQRPPYWMPGDDLSEIQKVFALARRPLALIANLGGCPLDVAANLRGADQPMPEAYLQYLEATQGPAAPSLQQAAGMDASAPPPPVQLAPPTPVGQVESGRINAPEARGLEAPSTPEEALALHQARLAVAGVAPAPVAVAGPAGDRNALKAQAKALGLVDDSSRLGADKLQAMINAYKAANPGAAVAPAPVASVPLPAAAPAPYNMPPPPVASIPAPAGARFEDEAFLEQVAERVFGKLKAALTVAFGGAA